MWSGRRRRERTVYFPWERRGVLGVVATQRRRARVWVPLLLITVLLTWLHARNVHARKVRLTRAALGTVGKALDAYRQDHDGRCPRELPELTAPGDRPPYLAHLPVDGWGRALRLICPSHRPGRSYDLLSDGPDGEPWGLDRIE